MPNIIFNTLLYYIYIYIYIYIYTEIVPKLTATDSVAQSVERWSRDPGTRVQSPAGGLGVAFFVTGPCCVLKCINYWHSNLVAIKTSNFLSLASFFAVFLKLDNILTQVFVTLFDVHNSPSFFFAGHGNFVFQFLVENLLFLFQVNPLLLTSLTVLCNFINSFRPFLIFVRIAAKFVLQEFCGFSQLLQY